MEEMEAPECHGIICTLCKSMGQATCLKYVETCTKSYMVTTTPPPRVLGNQMNMIVERGTREPCYISMNSL